MRPFQRRRQGEPATNVQDTAHSNPQSSPKIGPTSPPHSFPGGIKVLHPSRDAVVDICFVHGLTGDRERTWTAEGQSESWPEALLPSRLHQARILTWGYDAYITHKSAAVASTNRLIDHAKDLIYDLTDNRTSCNASSRPLIFVAHSLGGLVCKKAILLSRNNPESYLQGIFDAVKGVVFLGTPHKGAWIADWAKIPASIISPFKSTNVALLDILQTENQLLESIQVDFSDMVRQLREEGRGFGITCFFEELPMTSVVGPVVSKKSATLEGYGYRSIHANHKDMVRFASAEENGFKRLLGELTRWISEIDQVLPKKKQYTFDAGDRACLHDLQTTDPRNDKDRIQKNKGGLLKDSYRWVLDNEDFKKWRDEQQSQLLWIKGDPGKGKTMLLCGIIDELTTASDTTVSFFFCEETDARINHATAVLRGLITMLVEQQRSLISHVRRQYDKAGKRLFEDANAWEALSKIFVNILEDPLLQPTYLIIDALDECTAGLRQLLDLVVQKSPAYPQVKWVVTSRNWPDIEERLNLVTQKGRLWLELNEESVSEAVTAYIHHQVQELTKRKKYKDDVRVAVCDHLLSNAHGTFLWVALVCDKLVEARSWNTLNLLTSFPPGLRPLYRRMFERIRELGDDAELCKRILGVASTVYRPITLDEFPSLVDMPDGVAEDYEVLAEIIRSCGSFLTLRDRAIVFVHQSAKGFLLEEVSNEICAEGIKALHYTIFWRSLQLFKTLRRDIYGLKSDGFPIEKVRQPDPDPLANARYSCVYWVDHLQDCDTKENTKGDFWDSGEVDNFLKENLLHWIEALSLLRCLSEGIAAILKLDSLLQKLGKSQAPLERVRDASRFIRYHRLAIESSPLQVYCLSLIFSPSQSTTKMWYQKAKKVRADWVLKEPVMEDHWSPCFQTLEGHKGLVTSIAWSHNETWLASGSSDRTVRIWDSTSGQCVWTLEGHDSLVTSIAWSHYRNWLASGSGDRTVRIWNPTSGQCISTLEGHDGLVISIAWSHNRNWLASGSNDRTVRIWDPISGQCIVTLEGHDNLVTSIAWSHYGNWLASGSNDRTVRVWDSTSGQCVWTLEGHDSLVTSIAWSHYGNWLASGSNDRTVRVWDSTSGQCIWTLERHDSLVTSIAWSHYRNWLASGSGDRTVRIWNPTSGQCISTLEEHDGLVTSIAWSYDGNWLTSGSDNSTVKIWDPTSGQCTSTLEGHDNLVTLIAWSHDGNWLASGSDRTVRIWDPTPWQYTSTLERHGSHVRSIAWSHDGSCLASGSDDRTLRIWNPISGQCISTLEGHGSFVWSVAWSHDGSQLASGSDDKTIRIWDPISGQCISILEENKRYDSSVMSVAWSCDGSWLASGSRDRTVRIWDPVSEQRISILEGHNGFVTSIAWSHNGNWLASGSSDRTVRIWNPISRQCILILEGHVDFVRSIAWSHDGSCLASGSNDRTVRIWDSTTGECTTTLDASSHDLQFHTINLHHLYTDVGIFNLDSAVPVSTSDDLSTSLLQQVGYGFTNDDTWITFEGNNLLWLPPEYRPAMSSLFATSETTTMAIGCSSGRVLILMFSNNNLVS